MSLDAKQRADVACQILLSLEPADENVEQSWADEIRRRRDAIRDGHTTLHDWDDALRAIRQAVE